MTASIERQIEIAGDIQSRLDLAADKAAKEHFAQNDGLMDEVDACSKKIRELRRQQFMEEEYSTAYYSRRDDIVAETIAMRALMSRVVKMS